MLPKMLPPHTEDLDARSAIDIALKELPPLQYFLAWVEVVQIQRFCGDARCGRECFSVNVQ